MRIRRAFSLTSRLIGAALAVLFVSISCSQNTNLLVIKNTGTPNSFAFPHQSVLSLSWPAHIIGKAGILISKDGVVKKAPASVARLNFALDGSLIAISHYAPVPMPNKWQVDVEIQNYPTLTSKLRLTWPGINDNISPSGPFAFSRDNRIFSMLFVDGHLRSWDLPGGHMKNDIFIETPTAVTPGELAIDRGNVLICSPGGQKIVRYDFVHGLRDTGIRVPQYGCVGFSPNGNYACISEKAPAKLYDMRTNQELRELQNSTNRLFQPVFSSDGKLIAGADVSGVTLWDTNSGKIVTSLYPDQNGKGYIVALSPTQPLLAHTGADGKIYIWNYRIKKLLGTLSHGQYATTTLAFSPDGRVLASGSEDGTVKLWQVGKTQ